MFLNRRWTHSIKTHVSNWDFVTQSSFTFSKSPDSGSNFISSSLFTTSSEVFISSGVSIWFHSLHSFHQSDPLFQISFSFLDKFSLSAVKLVISCSILAISVSDAHKFLSTFASSCHFSINWASIHSISFWILSYSGFGTLFGLVANFALS